MWDDWYNYDQHYWNMKIDDCPFNDGPIKLII